jgi:hypothetical protein
LRYAKVELVPPTPGELGQVGQGIQRLLSGFRTGRWKQLTVKVTLKKKTFYGIIGLFITQLQLKLLLANILFLPFMNRKCTFARFFTDM